MEKIVPVIQIKPRPEVIHLREEPAIIPLQTTAPQQDPRKARDISFLDIVDNYNGDSEEPTANGLAKQLTYVERTSNPIHPDNLVKILQLEVPQNSLYIRGRSPISTEKTVEDLVDLPSTSTSWTFEVTILLDTFDTISVESLNQLIFGEKDKKEEIESKLGHFLLDFFCQIWTQDTLRHMSGPIMAIFDICQFLAAPGPFEYF